jgi:type I restriction enzyme S subunit
LELKPGYKRTEVGVIPEDWEVKQIQQVCGFIVPGRNKPRIFDGDIPWITTPDLIDGGIVLESRSLLRVSIDEAKAVGSKVVPKGSVLMSCVGELGIVALAGCDIVINQQLHAFLPSAAVRGVFLAQIIKTRKIYIDSVATKTALPYLNKDNCNSIPIPIPPLAEQEAIARTLSDADALIESIEQLIVKKRHIKQGAMQELLMGKRRLTGFDEARRIYKRTEIGTIPGDWRQSTIGAVTIKIGSGITPKGGSNNYKPHGRPFVRSQNIGWGNLRLADLAYIDDQTHDSFSATELKPCDVLLNITGASIGRSALVDARLAGGNVNQHVCIIRADPDHAVPSFINYFLLSSAGQRQIESYQAGGNREGLNFGQIRSINLPLPPTKAEQGAIAGTLRAMESEIVALEAKLSKARQIKQGMMHNLLTGKIRLV